MVHVSEDRTEGPSCQICVYVWQAKSVGERMLRTARTRGTPADGFGGQGDEKSGVERVQNDCEGDALGNDAIDAAEAWPGGLAESLDSCGVAGGFSLLRLEVDVADACAHPGPASTTAPRKETKVAEWALLRGTAVARGSGDGPLTHERTGDLGARRKADERK